MHLTASFDERLWLAIAEPSRRKLIDALLVKGEASASKLASLVPFSRQAVRKHLFVLEKAGLVTEKRAGKEVQFAIKRDSLAAATRELSRAADQWNARLLAIKEIAEELERNASQKPSLRSSGKKPE